MAAMGLPQSSATPSNVISSPASNAQPSAEFLIFILLRYMGSTEATSGTASSRVSSMLAMLRVK